ncbi:MAG: hypothetical protein O9327_02500 [Polaromonas sp.]|nr:hypothetical protein [Polaromonas sp.]
MELHTSSLIGPPLDWAVSHSLGEGDQYLRGWRAGGNVRLSQCETLRGYSENDAVCSPLIDGHLIVTRPSTNGFEGHEWAASLQSGHMATGPTRRVAALRVLVAKLLGDRVSVPDDLVETVAPTA